MYSLYKLPASSSGAYTAEHWFGQGTSVEGTAALIKEGLAWVVRDTSDRVVLQPSTVAGAGTHPPAAARNPNNYVHTFVRNRSTSAADYYYQHSTGWGSGSFGGLVTSELEAIRAGSGARIVMFTWGTGGLYMREQSAPSSTTGWGGWVDLSVPN